jgi:hypothetical protein
MNILVPRGFDNNVTITSTDATDDINFYWKKNERKTSAVGID